MKKPESANCHYCNRLLPRQHITFDHMTPKIAGGTARRGNLVFACPLCNLCKAHTHYAIFLIQISFVPIDTTVPLGSKRMKTYVRRWLRKVRALRLEHLATYDVRIAGMDDQQPLPPPTSTPVTSPALSAEDGDHSQDVPARSPATSL
jgi:hypothetical protein